MNPFVPIVIMLISVLGPSIVIALVGYESVKGLARNPFASAKIMLAMIVAFIFAESVAIISLLTVFLLLR
jgi:F0F1-type ATP synthase membrane subunit c/vacuolar-type H+-ATPase subunit K